jgi:WD40 repeat protein
VTTVAAERGGFVAAGSSAGAFAVWRAEASSERAASSSSSRDRFPSCGVIVRAAKGGWGAPNPADSNPRGFGFGFASGSGVGSGITALGFVSPDGGGGSTMSPAGSGDPVVRGGGSSNASSSSSGFASPSVGNAASSFLVVGGTRGGGVAAWDAATGACVLASPGSHAGAVTSAFAAGAGVVHHGAADDASDVGFGTNLSPALFLTTSDSPSDPRGVRLWDVRAGAREVAASLTGHRGGVTAVAVGGGGSGGFFGDPLVSSNSPLAVAFTGDGAGAVRAWDWRRAGGGATAAAPRAHVGAVTCVAPVGFRGDACVSGGADGVVRALRLDGGNGGGVRLRGHLGAVTSALVVRGGGGGTRTLPGGSGSFEGEDEGDDVLVLPPRTRVLRDASVSEDADASSRVPSSAASSSAATRRRGAHRRGFSISGLRAGARGFDGGGTLRGGSSLDFDFEEASSLEALGLTRDNDDGDGPDEGIGTVSEADPKAGTGGLALVSASADGTTRAWRRVDWSPRAAGAGWACVGAAHAHAAGIVAAGVSANGRGVVTVAADGSVAAWCTGGVAYRGGRAAAAAGGGGALLPPEARASSRAAAPRRGGWTGAWTPSGMRGEGVGARGAPTAVALEHGGRRLACGWRDGSVSSLDAPVPRGR